MEKNLITSENDDFEIIDFKRLFGLLRRNLVLLITGGALLALAAFLFSLFQTPIYSASTQVMVSRANSQGSAIDITQSLNPQQIAQTYVELLKQEWTLDKVIEQVGGAELKEGQVSISLASSTTPLIYISAEDADPARAVRIADALVQVLIEQNEAIQSGRYTAAEESLNLQIQQMEEQIAATQMQLELANENAYADQLTVAQTKIGDTQQVIETTRNEISQFNSFGSTARIVSLLGFRQGQFNELQALLDEQLLQYQAMSDDLAVNPLVQSDPLYAPTVQAQMAELGVAINDTRAQMETLSQEISFLTPLAEEGALERAIQQKQDFLASQEILLTTYQDSYTALLVSGKITTTSNEVAGLERNLNLYQQIYLGLLNNRETLRLDRIQNMPNVVQANPSIASENPVRPRTMLNTLLGGVAGLVLALSVVILRDFLDTTIKTREDVERAVGLPVLGSVLPMAENKEADGPFVTHSPRSPAAEAFRSLRTALEFSGAGKPIKSLLVTSSGAGEGKTIIATNLALIMAQGGKSVVIMDADLRRPRLHQELGISNGIGLSDIFRGKVNIEGALQSYGETNLSVITSGGIPPNPAELLASEKMVQILDELTSRFDMVIVDSTPTLVTDSQLIAARVDGVLVVVRAGETQADASRNTVELYRRVGARLLGVILNNVVVNNGYGYGDYSNNYTYYHYDEEHRSEKTGVGGFFKGFSKTSKRTARRMTK